MLNVVTISSYRTSFCFRLKTSSHLFSSIPKGYSVENEWTVVGADDTPIHSCIKQYYESINRCATVSECKKTVRKGLVWVNSKKANNQMLAQTDDNVCILYRSQPKVSRIGKHERTDVKKVEVIFEDAHCAVVNKPQVKFNDEPTSKFARTNKSV